MSKYRKKKLIHISPCPEGGSEYLSCKQSENSPQIIIFCYNLKTCSFSVDFILDMDNLKFRFGP